MRKIAMIAGVALIALTTSSALAQTSTNTFGGAGGTGSGVGVGAGGGAASGGASGAGIIPGGGGGGGVPPVINNTANADASADSEAASLSAAQNLGNNQGVVVEGSTSFGSDLGDAVPNVVVPSVIGNGACAGAGFSAGLGVSGLGLGVGATTIDEDCTIREYVTLLYNMCASDAGNIVWCRVADRMLLNEVDMINRAWNDVNPPPPPPPAATAAPAAAPIVPAVQNTVPATTPAVNCPPTAPANSGELTRLYQAGCRWN